jgi:hypothetical protein
MDCNHTMITYTGYLKIRNTTCRYFEDTVK